MKHSQDIDIEPDDEPLTERGTRGNGQVRSFDVRRG